LHEKQLTSFIRQRFSNLPRSLHNCVQREPLLKAFQKFATEPSCKGYCWRTLSVVGHVQLA